MEWTDIRLTVAKADADNAEAVATMIAEGGIYIEDYSDIEQQVAEIAHVDLIEQELLDKPRDQVIIHLYLEPGASPVETLALIAARMEAAGIAYTVETEGVEQEDWQNGWRKYYHPMEIGQRLAVVPSWQEYDTDRVKLILDPGLAFGTGGHETTSLCLEALDERVKGGERVLDIGTGSGILAIAALKLGAASAEGVDIDPVAVRTAGENAALNGVADQLTVLVGDLSDKASGTYEIITANIVANAILSLAPAVPGLMAEDAVFIASGIIDSRKDEVIAGLEAAGLAVQESRKSAAGSASSAAGNNRSGVPRQLPLFGELLAVGYSLYKLSKFRIGATMPHRYFTTEIADGTATLRGADAHHLARVMRGKLGDTVILCDGNAVEYTAVITGFGPETVEFSVEPGYPSAAEPSVEVTLFAGYPKQDKLEQVIRHGVELGCAHFVPFFSRYCVATPKKEEQKNERYNRIAFEAAKQCGRGILPDVALPLPNFGAVCRSLEGYDLVLFCYECGGAPLRELLANVRPADGKKPKIAVITGAEGGFAAEEAEMAAKAGARTVGLGPRILRCETAPLAVLSAVMTLTGNLE